MVTLIQEMALAELRVKLYGAAQLLKGEALDELKQLVGEIVMVLDLDGGPKREIAAGDVVRRRGSPQLMTVERVDVTDKDRPFAALCVWFVEPEPNEWSDLKRRLFDVDELERVTVTSAVQPSPIGAGG